MNDLREWLVSLMEDMPDENLLQIAETIEDAALTPNEEDPFYSKENMVRLRKSIAQLDQARAARKVVQDA